MNEEQVVQDLRVAQSIIAGWARDADGRVNIHPDAISKAVNAALVTALMTNIVHVPAEPGFYLAYKPTETNPSGRAPAKGRWETREQAQAALDEMGKHVTPPSDFNDFLHVIEVPEPEGK